MKKIDRVTGLFKGLCLTGAMVLSFAPAFAKENVMPEGVKGERNLSGTQTLFGKGAGACAAASAKRELDVNNVRTMILNGGDMWWNLSNARYEVPKVATGQVSKNALFSGALWIGGLTNGNIRVAAQTYRQSGNDFFPGPLTNLTASITSEECLAYDRIWRITLTEIDAFRNDETRWADPGEEIATWPTHGKLQGEAQFLAPFFNQGGSPVLYEPALGDYPSFDQNNSKNIPDMMLFMIANDKGNIHTETNGIPIGIELQTHCFAYSTNDEVNNMTFYRTVITNRSNEKIDSCVFGQWVDPDLGNYADDYVECIVDHSLGICYNGDDDDEGILGYGLNPPSVGVDFFQGPKRADGSEIGLSKFVYYDNNSDQVSGNPNKAADYWNYLNGKWKNGANITYGGNGIGGSDTASFMFPGTSDPAGRPNWTERTAGNKPADRRFLQTAGPFSLLPGAVNRITIGVVWARASGGGATGSFALLKQADEKAQALFDNNFVLISGPAAPVLDIVELGNKLIFKITNTSVTENFVDSFAGSVLVNTSPCKGKTIYKFQGYQVFQLKTPNIPSDIYDQTQAKLVFQSDIADAYDRLINATYDPILGDVKKIMVEGENKGVQHSFVLSKDLFETGADQTLVNFKDYHYVVVAYAAATNCSNDKLQFLGSAKTIGRNELTVYTVTPHDPAPRNNGIRLNSEYGMGIPVTQIEGMGNGGYEVHLSAESITEALKAENNYFVKERKYIAGYSPVFIKVIDPLRVQYADFTLWMRDTSSSTKKSDTLTSAQTVWYLRNNTTGEVRASSTAIDRPNEQLFPEWGLSINISQSIRPGDDLSSATDLSNGFITSNMIFSNPAQKWLSGVTDEDSRFTGFYGTAPQVVNPFNWIRSGNAGGNRTPTPFADGRVDDFAKSGGPAHDSRKNFSKIINSTWSPYMLAASWQNNSTPTPIPTFGPGWAGTPAGTASIDLSMSDLYSVNVVYTPDKSKWTRCMVVETGEDPKFNYLNAEKLDMRSSPSVDKNGKTIAQGARSGATDPEAADYISPTGMGWFPGYAVNIETGERLNILFGEDSSLPTENGNDMVWNPTTNLLDGVTIKDDRITALNFQKAPFRPFFGGKHYVYVMGNRPFKIGSNVAPATRYDMCQQYIQKLNDLSLGKVIRKRLLYSQAMWTSIPMLKEGFSLTSPEQGLVPSQAEVQIRVKRAYAAYSIDGATINDGYPYFSFNTRGYIAEAGVELGRKALDLVSVVPNPYYAYSKYEDPGNRLDNRIRITNLPNRCLINIYTMDGVLVRTIRKDDDSRTFVEWDLKNDAKAPLASGVYLIHVKATDFGEERIIKWFGIMRTADYDSF